MVPVNVGGVLGKPFRVGSDGITAITELELAHGHRKIRIVRDAGKAGIKVGWIDGGNVAGMEYAAGHEPGAPTKLDAAVADLLGLTDRSDIEPRRPDPGTATEAKPKTKRGFGKTA